MTEFSSAHSIYNHLLKFHAPYLAKYQQILYAALTICLFVGTDKDYAKVGFRTACRLTAVNSRAVHAVWMNTDNMQTIGRQQGGTKDTVSVGRQ